MDEDLDESWFDSAFQNDDLLSLGNESMKTPERYTKNQDNERNPTSTLFGEDTFHISPLKLSPSPQIKKDKNKSIRRSNEVFKKVGDILSLTENRNDDHGIDFTLNISKSIPKKVPSLVLQKIPLPNEYSLNTNKMSLGSVKMIIDDDVDMDMQNKNEMRNFQRYTRSKHPSTSSSNQAYPKFSQNEQFNRGNPQQQQMQQKYHLQQQNRRQFYSQMNAINPNSNHNQNKYNQLSNYDMRNNSTQYYNGNPNQNVYNNNTNRGFSFGNYSMSNNNNNNGGDDDEMELDNDIPNDDFGNDTYWNNGMNQTFSSNMRFKDNYEQPPQMMQKKKFFKTPMQRRGSYSQQRRNSLSQNKGSFVRSQQRRGSLSQQRSNYVPKKPLSRFGFVESNSNYHFGGNNTQRFMNQNQNVMQQTQPNYQNHNYGMGISNFKGNPPEEFRRHSEYVQFVQHQRNLGMKKTPQRKVKRSMSVVSVQVMCAIYECDNQISNRTRFSLKTNPKIKPMYTQNGMDKICDRCYFRDRYQYRKKLKEIEQAEKQKK